MWLQEKFMSKKRTPKKRRPGKSKKTQSNPIPDRRSMDKMMADIGRLLESQEFEDIDEVNAYFQQMMASGESIPSASPRTPIEEAQDLMYDAIEASGKQRIKLAKKALTISRDCADAYVLLAEESAGSLPEARDLYAAGVEAGKRASRLSRRGKSVTNGLSDSAVWRITSRACLSVNRRWSSENVLRRPA